jgi:hypothetical protein
MFNKKKKKKYEEKNKKQISRFFQHFPSFSRDQDHDENNTPASDDRGGRNFHLPNICTSIFSHYNKYFKIVFFCNCFVSLSFYFSITCFLHPSTYVEIQKDNYNNDKKFIKKKLVYFRKLFQV